MKLTNEQLKELRDEVFGPCTVIGECFELDELEADLKEPADLREWFKIRLYVELNDIFPEWKYPDGPTEAQLAKENKVEKEVTERLTANFEAFLAKLKS